MTENEIQKERIAELQQTIESLLIEKQDLNNCVDDLRLKMGQE